MPESAAATEGTRAHELGEKILLHRLEMGKTKQPPSAMFEELLCDDFDVETADNVMSYVEDVWSCYVGRLSQGFEVTLHIELRVKLASVHPDAFGTSDAVVACEKGPLDVFDYKNGHLYVDVVNNSQAKYYAIGCQETLELEFTEYNLHIHQPNAGGLKSWTVTDKELNAFCTELQDAADAVYKDDAPRIAGPQCEKFCNRAECPEYQSRAAVVFKELELPTCPAEANIGAPTSVVVADLSAFELGRLLDLEDYVKAMASDAKKILKQKLLDSEDAGDYKLIQGKGNFKLTVGLVELSKILKMPQDQLSDAKLKSKTAVEKAIKAKFKDDKAKKAKIELLAEVCERPDGEIKLVRKSAKGEDYLPTTFQPLDLIT